MLVPNGSYRERPEYEWGTVERIKEGDGSPYPVVVRFDDGVKGQFRFDEVTNVRPVEFSREMVPSEYTEEEYEAWKRRVQDDH